MRTPRPHRRMFRAVPLDELDAAPRTDGGGHRRTSSRWARCGRGRTRGPEGSRLGGMTSMCSSAGSRRLTHTDRLAERPRTQGQVADCDHADPRPVRHERVRLIPSTQGPFTAVTTATPRLRVPAPRRSVMTLRDQGPVVRGSNPNGISRRCAARRAVSASMRSVGPSATTVPPLMITDRGQSSRANGRS